MRPTVAWSLPFLSSLDLVCLRALPAGEPAEGRAFHARWVKDPLAEGGWVPDHLDRFGLSENPLLVAVVCSDSADTYLEVPLTILFWTMACSWLSTPGVESGPASEAQVVEEDRNPERMLSETLVLAKTEKLVLEESMWRLGERRGWVWLVRMPRSAELTVWPSTEIQRLGEFPKLGVDGVMVNGGFYDEAAMGLVLHSGKVESPQTDVGGSGIVSWSPEVGLQVTHRDAYEAEGLSEAVQSVDRLVDGGQSLVRVREGVPETARVAVGHSASEVLVAIAGGWESTERVGPDLVLGASEDDGLPLWGFGELLVELGFERALNLDGGISTEGVVRIDGEERHVRGGIGTINAVQLIPGASGVP